MENTKNITKIIIDCHPLYDCGSILTITKTSISYESKKDCDGLFNWSYNVTSRLFGYGFGNICELVEKLSIPVPNNTPVTIYEFSITFAPDKEILNNSV